MLVIKKQRKLLLLLKFINFFFLSLSLNLSPLLVFSYLRIQIIYLYKCNKIKKGVPEFLFVYLYGIMI